MANLQPLHTFVVVSDQDSTFETLSELFKSAGYDLSSVHQVNSLEVSDIDLDGNIDVILIDDRLKASSSLEMLETLQELFPHKAKLMLTRRSDRKRAVEAMKKGATDYLFKRDLNRESFEKALQHCLEYTHHHEMLSRRNALIDALFDQAEEAIFLADNQGRIILFNEVFTALFQNGKSEQENFMQFLKEYVTDQPLDKFVPAKDSVSKTIKSENSDGIKHLKVNLKKIKLPDGFERILGMISDITAQVVAEQEQLKGEKLQLTSRMAQILAHEVRNPLTNIRLSTDYLNEALKGDSEYATYAEIIERNVIRIDGLINHMLQSVKPFEIDKSETDLRAFMDRVVEMVNDRKELIGAKVDVSVSGKVKAWPIDDEKLELALLNLLSNAFEAMGGNADPRLNIEVSNVDGQLLIVIQDNGKGMSQEILDRLFDAFYTNRKGGMGLGMTMVKNIIQGHDGHLEVSSAENEGTRFSIYLPS